MKVTSLVAITLLMVSAASASEKPSQAFLAKAIQGNYAEVQMGQLAQKQGQNDGVKKFGQMLSDDHSAANPELVGSVQVTQAAAAKRLGVTQPRLSDLLRGRLSRFSLDALIALADRAGLAVSMEIMPAAA